MLENVAQIELKKAAKVEYRTCKYLSYLMEILYDKSILLRKRLDEYRILINAGILRYHIVDLDLLGNILIRFDSLFR